MSIDHSLESILTTLIGKSNQPGQSLDALSFFSFFLYFFNSSKSSNLEGANLRGKKISLVLQLLLKSAKLSSRKCFRNWPSAKSNLREIYQNQVFEIG